MVNMTKKLTKLKDGTIVSPIGFKSTGIHSGIKARRKDLGLIYCEQPASAAAVYTTNVIQAAPLQVTKNSLTKEGKLQAIVVNSGNANACTGEQGMQDALEMQALTAKKFGINNDYVAVASTGVIGEFLPMEKIKQGIERMTPANTAEEAHHFNEAILTTDTVTKSTCYQTVIDGKTVTMAGSAKGSGMIAPNMATMLAFITTDVAITPGALQIALTEATDHTFNCITVDGDTSTNDNVIVMASGLAGNETITPEHSDWQLFVSLLRQTCEDLAKMIARDGEGATKLVEVEVRGAKNDKEALQVAKTVVGSALVKTAVFGADANWGRIMMALGNSGATINPNTIDLALGPIQLLKNSQPLSYTEEEASAYLKNEEVKILIDLHVGSGTGKGWGCDLTYDYVQINASYRS